MADSQRTDGSHNDATAAGIGPSDLVPTDAFRRFMAGFPSGVTVVTAVDAQGNPSGMTCSSLCSASLDPPMLLVCLRRDSPTLHAVLCRSAFTVNLLHSAAQPTAELFASGAPDRFARVRWSPGPGTCGPRLTQDSHALADCRVSGVVPGGDHMVVFGEVRETVVLTGDPPSAASQVARPLLHGLRRYASWPIGQHDRCGDHPPH
jgi:flavin reductase (DIM6/NTAB) family NADH-FMN oxidoreductase RutF